ncbi:UNVERIFIED_CONTAM: hypothetical protein B566_EDAN019466, partial [Ephemera danica]
DEESALCSLKQCITSKEAIPSDSREARLARRHFVDEGILYRKCNMSNTLLAVIPSSVAEPLIKTYHEFYGHYGTVKIAHILKENFYIPNLIRQVQAVVAACALCQKTKHPNKKFKGPTQPTIPTEPNELVALDLYGPLPKGRGGVTYILVLLAVFTKFLILYALKRATTRGILNRLKLEYFLLVSRPKGVLHDHGSQFTAKSWREELAAEGVQISFTSVRHPESNSTSLQDEESALCSLKQCITSKEAIPSDSREARLARRHFVDEGILYRKCNMSNTLLAVIPSSVAEPLIKTYHEFYGHYGTVKIAHILKENFYIPNLIRQVQAVVAACALCQKTKHPNKKFKGPTQPTIPTEPNELVALDLYGPLPKGRGGVTYILVLLAVFTKFLILYALKRATTRGILNRLKLEYFLLVSRPKGVLHDHGSQFTAKSWREELAAEGVQISFTSVRHPESNSSERVMREIGRFCRAYCSENHSMWCNLLPKIMLWHNCTYHASIGYTPYELHYGCKPVREISKMLNFPQLEGPKPDPSNIFIMAREKLRKTAEY